MIRQVMICMCLGMMLSACSVLDQVDGALADAQKGLAAAHLAHAAAADALVTAAPVMSASARSVAKGYLDRSESDLGLADEATDAATMVADTALATNLIAEAKAVIP